MNLPIRFARWSSSLIATIFITSSFLISRPSLDGSLMLNAALGLIISGVFCFLLVTIEKFCRKCHFKIFNTLIFGLLVGILLGKAFTSIFDTLLFNLDMIVSNPIFFVILPKSLLYLMSIHFAIVMAMAYGEDLLISIPFIKFSEVISDKKEVILSESILSDPRIIDFLSTGILNNRLILPTFIVNNLTTKLEDSNTKKILEVIEKLKGMKSLSLKENSTDFKETSDIVKKTYLLAKMTKSNILIGDKPKLENEASEIQYINLTSIAEALKNAMSAGENMVIKVQRYGKEPKQGIGYLEDGTMVVINNGGHFIGEVIDTKVISVKQTTAGRIIFTNAIVEEEDGEYAYDGESKFLHTHE